MFSRVLPHLGVLSHNEVPAQISITALATLD
jgi:flagellar biosynthesis component FlhA